jgi:hypothetical protein
LRKNVHVRNRSVKNAEAPGLRWLADWKYDWRVKKKKGKYPRFTGGADQTTKPDLRRRKPQKSFHAHDDFEIEIDVETEITAVDQPMYTGESVTTDELIAPKEDEILTQQMDVSDLDLELPRSSGDQVLPVYVSSKEQLKPTPKQEKPPPAPPEKAPFPQTPLSTSDKQDILDLFDDPENASLSVELPPAQESSSPPLPEPDEFEIVRPGEKTGMRPLDGDLFDSRPPPRRKKDRKWLGPVKPPPMAHSEQIVERRFHFTLRQLVLLILVLVIAAGLVIAWFMYQDYRERENLKELDRGRELIERSKYDAILEKTKSKDQDIPYKDKIDTPQGGRSGNE